MNKTINRITYNKAKFLRATCKNCGKELKHGQIIQGFSWCNKKCKTEWIIKNNKKPKKRYAHFGIGFDYEGNSV